MDALIQSQEAIPDITREVAGSGYNTLFDNQEI